MSSFDLFKYTASGTTDYVFLFKEKLLVREMMFEKSEPNVNDFNKIGGGLSQ